MKLTRKFKTQGLGLPGSHSEEVEDGKQSIPTMSAAIRGEQDLPRPRYAKFLDAPHAEDHAVGQTRGKSADCQKSSRYPLLLYAILDRLPPESDKYATAAKALNSANKIVRECNEGARRMERTEQLLDIERRLVYKDPQLR